MRDFRAICQVASHGDSNLNTRIETDCERKEHSKKMSTTEDSVNNEKGKNAFSKLVLPVPKNRSRQALQHD